MDDSPLSKLPGELRNDIYNYVLGSGCMTVSGDDDGLSYNEAKHYLALTRTCKQIREESAAFVTEITDFLIQPTLRASKCGNHVIHKPFNLDKWLDRMVTLPKMRPQTVMLHVGQFDEAVEPRASSRWLNTRRAEWEDILPLLPRPTPRSDVQCTFYIHATVQEECTGMMEFAFPLHLEGDPVRQYAPDEEHGRVIVEAVVKGKKRLLKTLLKDDWVGLTASELLTERRKVWGRLYAVEQRMLEFLCHLREPGDPSLNWRVGKAVEGSKWPGDDTLSR